MNDLFLTNWKTAQVTFSFFFRLYEAYARKRTTFPAFSPLFFSLYSFAYKYDRSFGTVHIYFEEIDAEDSTNSLSEVISLDSDFDTMYLESNNSDEEVTDDDVDSHSWNEIEQESDARFLEDHGLIEEVSSISEDNAINLIDSHRHFITNKIMTSWFVKLIDTRNNALKKISVSWETKPKGFTNVRKPNFFPETDSETLWRFSRIKKWVSECSETLKRFSIVTNPESEKSFWEKNPFPRFGNPFRFPGLLLSKTFKGFPSRFPEKNWVFERSEILLAWFPSIRKFFWVILAKP
jgi:hypothetical protein